MNLEKSICLKPGVLIKMSLIVLHTHYTYIVPEETKSTTKSINLGKPVETSVSHLTVYLFLIKKVELLGMYKCLSAFPDFRHFWT